MVQTSRYRSVAAVIFEFLGLLLGCRFCRAASASFSCAMDPRNALRPARTERVLSARRYPWPLSSEPRMVTR
jgi:hypothetical protein